MRFPLTKVLEAGPKPPNFPAITSSVSPVPSPKPRWIPRFFVIGFALAGAFALWSWLQPYDGRPDPAAGCRVVATRVQRDLGYFWLDVHLRADPAPADLLATPLRLRLDDGRTLTPADLRVTGETGQPRELWLKFWLERADLEGKLGLEVGQGVLRLKSKRGIPDLEHRQSRDHTSHRWGS
ncbi:MAG: hypothetical protein FJ385_06470 [Verrucomicrobia bacterium]|nr:hypothetical protein [Verrucomicrobiota bacterium]